MRNFYNNPLPAILCIVLAVIVMFAPIDMHKSENAVAIENAAAFDFGKDILLQRDGINLSQKKVAIQTPSVNSASFLAARDKLKKHRLASKGLHLHAHGSFLFLHMLKLF